MHRYFLRLISVLSATIAIAAVAGAILDKIYKQRWKDIFFDKATALIRDEKSYDVIFLGDSRVHFGINPYYFDSVSGYNSFNFGYGASDAQETLMTTNIFLQKHPPPKIAVLSLSHGCMTENIALQTRFHNLFFLDDDTVSIYMNKAGFRTGAIRLFPFLKYSFFDEYNRTSLFLPNKPPVRFDHNICKGFINVHQQLNTDAIYLYNIDGLWMPSINYFKTTVKTLLAHHVKVIVVSAPERSNSVYRESKFRKEVDSIFQHTANEYRVPYLHFEHDTAIFKNEFFVDDVHLNEPGTRIFSRQLADSLLRYR